MEYNMASGNNQVTIDALLKEYYDDGALVNETYVKNPLWARMIKTQAVANVTGRSFVHPIVVATSQGRNTSFSKALTNGDGTGEVSYDFTVTRINNYQNASVATETVLSTMDDRGAFTKAVTLITDNCLRNLGLDQAQSMYGNGSGTRGNAGNSTQQPSFATPTLVFAIADSSLNFEINMELVVAASETASPRALGSAGHGLYVGSVDRTLGTISVVTALGGSTPCNLNDATNGIPTIANGDYVFVINDQGQKMAGLQAWLPYGGPTSTLFFGVNRTVDPVRLAGNWLDGSQLSVEDAFIQATVNVAKQGYDLTHFFVPYNKYAQLLKSQSAKVAIIEEVNPDISFEGLQVLTPSGNVIVMPDRNCPPNRMFGLNIDTWDYIHLGDPVQMFNYDGNTWLRQVASDGMGIRFFSLGNLVCRVPAANIVIAVQP